MFKRNCKGCGKRFQPAGKACKLCDKCHTERQKTVKQKNVMQKPKLPKTK